MEIRQILNGMLCGFFWGGLGLILELDCLWVFVGFLGHFQSKFSNKILENFKIHSYSNFMQDC
jgi:hypothetical protein